MAEVLRPAAVRMGFVAKAKWARYTSAMPSRRKRVCSRSGMAAGIRLAQLLALFRRSDNSAKMVRDVRGNGFRRKFLAQILPDLEGLFGERQNRAKGDINAAGEGIRIVGRNNDSALVRLHQR